MLSRELVARIALAAAVAGIALLFLASSIDTPLQIRTGEINKELIGKSIEVMGVVLWSAKKNNTMLFELYDGNKIKAVLFNPSLSQSALVKKGVFLRITGKAKSYKGEMEIVAERVERYG